MVSSAVTVFLTLTLTGVAGQEAAFPANSAAVVGDNATLRCGYQETSCFQIRWEKRSELGRLENISDGDTVYDATKYHLNASSFCDLIIEDVQMTDSGTFVCTVNGLNSGSADLIVLQAKPSCSSSCDSNSTAENNNMIDFACKLTYRGGAIPEMIWWNSRTLSEVPDVPPQQLNGSTVSRDFSATAEAHGLVPPVCVTRFHFDPIYGRASNDPKMQCEPESCNKLIESGENEVDDGATRPTDRDPPDIDIRIKIRTATGAGVSAGAVALGIAGTLIYKFVINRNGYW